MIWRALEQIVAARLSALAETYNLIPEFQMGARSKRNTITALDLLTEQIHTVWGCSRQWVASMLSLDMVGAFDHVSHLRLLHILRRLGIPQWIVRWVESFLQDRYSTIKIHSEESELLPVQNRVPQGSPISSILFLFFNKELVQICNSTGTRASAIGFLDNVNILA
jgi:Reverse transcriptase (RNA-dependent DNA polymerase)